MANPPQNPVLDLLSTRRSVKPDRLVAPGPTAAELDTMLTIAARVPDHKKLVPWRFIVLEGEARARLGEVIAQACVEAEKEPPSQVRLDMERGRLMRAPLVIAVVSRVVAHRSAPEWEQILSAGAPCFNLCLAANAMGYGTSWITEWIAYNARVRAALGLAESERIVGFVYVGTPAERSEERERPNLADIVTRWQG
jgi:nitroreductase